MTKADKGMCNAAFVLGILTVISAVFMLVWIPMILGGIAIICVILSRDKYGKMDKTAVIGLILACFGLVLNVIIVTESIYTVATDPAKYAEFNDLFKQFYGIDFGTYLDELKSSTGMI